MLRLSAACLATMALSAIVIDGSAQAADKIYPSSTSISVHDSSGALSYIPVPIRFYSEVGYSARNGSDPAFGVVDQDSLNITLGVDFLAGQDWYLGFAVSVAGGDDNGSIPFAPSVVTEGRSGTLSIYVAKKVFDGLTVGVGGSYTYGEAETVYNFADIVTQDSRSFGISPFVSYTAYKDAAWTITVGARGSFNFSDFDYVNNIPPNATLNRQSVHFPISVTRQLTDEFSVTGSVTLNQILSQDTFTTVPPLDETTITLGAGMSYALHFGPVLSLRAGVDLLDDTYDSYFATVGIAMPLY